MEAPGLRRDLPAVRTDLSERCRNDVDVANMSIPTPIFCRNGRSSGAKLDSLVTSFRHHRLIISHWVVAWVGRRAEQGWRRGWDTGPRMAVISDGGIIMGLWGLSSLRQRPALVISALSAVWRCLALLRAFDSNTPAAHALYLPQRWTAGNV